MKLSEITTPVVSAAVETWLDHHARIIDVNDWNDGQPPIMTGYDIAKALNDRQKIRFGNGAGKLWLEFNYRKYTPIQLNVADWSKAFGAYIKHVVYAGAELHDSSDLFVPDGVDEIYLSEGTISNLKCLANVKCNWLVFENPKIKCGLLGLLKSKGIERVRGDYEYDRDVEHALRIIDDHMKGDRSIPDCMDDLIAAGLKEYAKL